MNRCKWCNAEFEPVDPNNPDQLYCKPHHGTKAAASRKQARILGRCPKPYKRLFATEEEANLFIKQHNLRNTFAYRCPSDICFWHIATDRNKVMHGNRFRRKDS